MSNSSKHARPETWAERADRLVRELEGPARHVGAHHPDTLVTGGAR